MPRASCTITVAEVARTIRDNWAALATLEPNMPESLCLATMGPTLHRFCTSTRRLNCSVVEQACIDAAVPPALLLPKFLVSGFQHMVLKHRHQVDGSQMSDIEKSCVSAIKLLITQEEQMHRANNPPPPPPK
eukprot:5062420-Amphidinium_carterae.1